MLFITDEIIKFSMVNFWVVALKHCVYNYSCLGFGKPIWEDTNVFLKLRTDFSREMCQDMKF